jgi:hypothetical protein
LVSSNDGATCATSGAAHAVRGCAELAASADCSASVFGRRRLLSPRDRVRYHTSSTPAASARSSAVSSPLRFECGSTATSARAASILLPTGRQSTGQQLHRRLLRVHSAQLSTPLRVSVAVTSCAHRSLWFDKTGRSGAWRCVHLARCLQLVQWRTRFLLAGASRGAFSEWVVGKSEGHNDEDG